MTIRLDHLIVPSRNPIEGAKFLAGLLDVPWEERLDPFAPVHVNDTLTVDFAARDTFESHHYCFGVGDAEFDAILGRIQAAGIKYRSRPRGENDMRINTRVGGRGVYWEDADGHLWEILTASYAHAGAPALTSSA
jgi:catechol 2,3-dioxygenase-like lactoylglutathione lyase family enzyme